MKKYSFIFTFLLSFVNHAQTWQHIDASDYHPGGQFYNGNNYQRNFSINPYDNSIWMTGQCCGTNYYINTFDPDGNYIVYDRTTIPVFEQFSDFKQIEFTSNKTFVISDYSGLFSFDGNDWMLENGYADGCSISADKDTIWMARTNQNYIKWVNDVNFWGNHNVRRIISKNGIKWSSTGQWDIIAKYNESTGSTYYSPDTSNLLSWNNYDFKFPHFTDTMYTSSDLGFSLAYNGKFIDTITPNNTTNMPGASVIEFEFDQNDNIWALFAPDFMLSTDPTHLAFYDQQTKNWSKIYDNSNSPFVFSQSMTFELDTAGNVWVINNGDLFILKMNNWPVWLDALEVDEKSIEVSFKVYPNPTTEEIHFQLNGTSSVDKIEITDVQGRIVQALPYSETIKLANKTAGSYFIKLYNKNEIIGVEKFILE